MHYAQLSKSPRFSLNANTILTYLQHCCMGRENARPIRELAASVCMDRREFEQCTEELREAGIPLCSSCSKPLGLYIARNYAEMLPWVKQLESRTKSMIIHRNQAVKQLKEIMERDGYQTELFMEETANV